MLKFKKKPFKREQYLFLKILHLCLNKKNPFKREQYLFIKNLHLCLNKKNIKNAKHIYFKKISYYT